MLKKQHRLAKTEDVKNTVRAGRSFFNPLFTVKVNRRGGVLPRFTVVVSTKVSKKAVVRNRIKRVLREEIRTRLADFPAGDYAVLVKPKAATVEAAELREKFITLLPSLTKKV
jgi:ribonuclease P protein component